ncbi:hypothetical protein ACI77J_28245, partial [Pseudomonas sp. O64]|uniref:hypothetical protein n=1 Tax=unclassified Pseudomonas TaxID=196821 RepID=UPI00387B0A92
EFKASREVAEASTPDYGVLSAGHRDAKEAEALVNTEKAALERIGSNPKGPDLTDKAPNTVLDQQDAKKAEALVNAEKEALKRIADNPKGADLTDKVPNTVLDQQLAKSTETAKFKNMFPDDPIVPGPRYELIKTDSGGFKYRLPSGEIRTPKGQYDFIQSDGKIYVAVQKNDSNVSGHVALSRGADVDFAGQVQFSQKGGLKSWDNMSGHYQPPETAAKRVDLPQDKFVPVE